MLRGKWALATRAARLAATAWILGVATLWLIQDRAEFPRDGRVLERPSAWDTGFSEGHATTSDGVPLSFWAAPPRHGMPVVIYLHGNAGIGSDRSASLRPVVGAGYGVVLGEWRGYGGNPGTPSERGLDRDALALSDWAARRWPGSPQVAWGESIGTSPAVFLAAMRPVAGVVLDAPFTSVRAVAQRAFPFAPVTLLLSNPFDSMAMLPRVRAPLMVMHGLADPVVPSWMGRRVLAAAPCPAGGLFMPGVGHVAMLSDDSGRAVGAALRFLAVVADGTASAACP